MSLPPQFALAASNWNDSYWVGFAPTREKRLSTAHAELIITKLVIGLLSQVFSENNEISITASWDPEAQVWVAVSDDVLGLAPKHARYKN